MKTADIITELANLPVEERVLIADNLLKTLNSPQPEIEQAWVSVAQQRLAEISGGQVLTISAQEVFDRLSKKLDA
jgi:hypothetical protein